MDLSVSVVIPTYNSGSFIGATLNSVFAQTLPPREVIVVDDASADDTADQVATASQIAPFPVRLIRQPANSGGPAHPLNVGTARASGPLIATLDHDDLMLPDKLRHQVACLARDKQVGLVFGKCLGRSSDGCAPKEFPEAEEAVASLARESLGGPYFRVRGPCVYEALVRWGNFGLTCSNFLFPKRVWEECGGFDERLPSACDYGFIQNVSQKFDLGFVDEPLMHWRVRDDSFYKVSHRLVRCRDFIRIYARFIPGRLSPLMRRSLRMHIRDERLLAAYLAREEGNYRESLGHYLASIFQGGWSLEAVSGLAKLFPHQLLRQARSGHALGRRPL